MIGVVGKPLQGARLSQVGPISEIRSNWLMIPSIIYRLGNYCSSRLMTMICYLYNSPCLYLPPIWRKLVGSSCEGPTTIAKLVYIRVFSQTGWGYLLSSGLSPELGSMSCSSCNSTSLYHLSYDEILLEATARASRHLPFWPQFQYWLRVSPIIGLEIFVLRG